MNKVKIVASGLLVTLCFVASAAEKTPEKSHGMEYPTGWQNWSTIAVSHRTDNNTLRGILGNEIAVKAARWQRQSVARRFNPRKSSLERH